MKLDMHAVLVQPLLTEKLTGIRESTNTVGFIVHPDANRLQIKQAVEELFKVRVLDVNVSTTKAKEKSRNRRRGRVQGYTSPWRKAVVTVRPTDKIEFFEGV